MAADTLIALFIFAIVSCATPGPNNMMLLASGATFGFRRTMPHILGISGGCAVMFVMLGFGLAELMARVPAIFGILYFVSTSYLLYLAWRIARSTSVAMSSQRARPMTFLEAAAFQWVNPKAWAMTLGAVTSFARHDHFFTDLVAVTIVICGLGLPCIMLWAGGGTLIRRLLSRPAALRAFNVGMAVLLVLSLIPGLLDQAWPI